VFVVVRTSIRAVQRHLAAPFCRANCSVFENTDENKLEYMDLFTKYTDRVEQYLEKRIEDAFPGLTLDAVGEMMKDRADEVAVSQRPVPSLLFVVTAIVMPLFVRRWTGVARLLRPLRTAPPAARALRLSLSLAGRRV
jgi:hypothetical protein